MFTGLVEGTAAVVASRSERGGLWLQLDLGAVAEGVGHGDSICVAGVCLSVVALDGPLASFDLSPETLSLTRFSSVSVGQAVNVERSLRAGDRLGGHFVSGHVDGLGEFLHSHTEGDYQTQEFRAPEAVARLLIPKGSVTVDGVSLTVASLPRPDHFTVALIPETLQRTTLSQLAVGDPVHLEGDLLGKYVLAHMERLTASGPTAGAGPPPQA